MNNIGISQRSIGIVDQDTGSVKIEHILSYDLIASPAFETSCFEEYKRQIQKENRIKKINQVLDDTNT